MTPEAWGDDTGNEKRDLNSELTGLPESEREPVAQQNKFLERKGKYKESFARYARVIGKCLKWLGGAPLEAAAVSASAIESAPDGARFLIKKTMEGTEYLANKYVDVREGLNNKTKEGIETSKKALLEAKEGMKQYIREINPLSNFSKERRLQLRTAEYDRLDMQATIVFREVIRASDEANATSAAFEEAAEAFRKASEAKDNAEKKFNKTWDEHSAIIQKKSELHKKIFGAFDEQEDKSFGASPALEAA